MTTKSKAAAEPEDAATVSDYDPVAHMLQEQVDDLKAQLKAAEKRLADHLG